MFLSCVQANTEYISKYQKYQIYQIYRIPSKKKEQQTKQNKRKRKRNQNPSAFVCLVTHVVYAILTN